MRRYLLLVPLLAGFLAIGIGITERFRMAPQHSNELLEWQQSHSEERILGRSADELIAEFGRPTATLQDKNGALKVLVFTGPRGAMCTIDFKDGLASSVKNRGE